MQACQLCSQSSESDLIRKAQFSSKLRSESDIYESSVYIYVHRVILLIVNGGLGGPCPVYTGTRLGSTTPIPPRFIAENYEDKKKRVSITASLRPPPHKPPISICAPFDPSMDMFYSFRLELAVQLTIHACIDHLVHSHLFSSFSLLLVSTMHNKCNL